MPVVLSVLALVLALVAAGLAFRPALSAPASADRTINVLAVEYKGTAGAGRISAGRFRARTARVRRARMCGSGSASTSSDTDSG